MTEKQLLGFCVERSDFNGRVLENCVVLMVELVLEDNHGSHEASILLI